MIFSSPEAITRITPLNPYERSEDGRPRVPDDLLERMKLVTNDEAWGVLERRHGPSAIAQVTLVGVNVPIRIGNATVLPGDVVLGTREGVSFIPPHLVQEVVERSEAIRRRLTGRLGSANVLMCFNLFG